MHIVQIKNANWLINSTEKKDHSKENPLKISWKYNLNWSGGIEVLLFATRATAQS